MKVIPMQALLKEERYEKALSSCLKKIEKEISSRSASFLLKLQNKKDCTTEKDKLIDGICFSQHISFPGLFGRFAEERDSAIASKRQQIYLYYLKFYIEDCLSAMEKVTHHEKLLKLLCEGYFISSEATNKTWQIYSGLLSKLSMLQKEMFSGKGEEKQSPFSSFLIKFLTKLSKCYRRLKVYFQARRGDGKAEKNVLEDPLLSKLRSMEQLFNDSELSKHLNDFSGKRAQLHIPSEIEEKKKDLFDLLKENLKKFDEQHAQLSLIVRRLISPISPFHQISEEMDPIEEIALFSYVKRQSPRSSINRLKTVGSGRITNIAKIVDFFKSSKGVAKEETNALSESPPYLAQSSESIDDEEAEGTLESPLYRSHEEQEEQEEMDEMRRIIEEGGALVISLKACFSYHQMQLKLLNEEANSHKEKPKLINDTVNSKHEYQVNLTEEALILNERAKKYCRALDVDLSQPVYKATLKKTFRNLALKYHPDKNRDPEAEEKFKKILDVFEKLNQELDGEKQFDISEEMVDLKCDLNKIFAEIDAARSDINDLEVQTVKIEQILIEARLETKSATDQANLARQEANEIKGQLQASKQETTALNTRVLKSEEELKQIKARLSSMGINISPQEKEAEQEKKNGSHHQNGFFKR